MAEFVHGGSSRDELVAVQSAVIASHQIHQCRVSRVTERCLAQPFAASAVRTRKVGDHDVSVRLRGGDEAQSRAAVVPRTYCLGYGPRLIRRAVVETDRSARPRLPANRVCAAALHRGATDNNHRRRDSSPADSKYRRPSRCHPSRSSANMSNCLSACSDTACRSSFACHGS